MAQRDNRCSCKKSERIFLCQTAFPNWVLGVFWVLLQNGYLEIDYAKWFLIFQIAQGPRSLFLVYKLGLKKWLNRIFENHFDEKKIQSYFN